MILKLLLNTQMLWMLFKKILKNTTQIKKRKILIIFDDINTDIFRNKNLSPIGTEFFIRGRKLNIYFVFITKSYFAVPKNIKLNSTHYFITKISNDRELQQIA